MSTVHDSWQLIDDEQPVPVHAAASRVAEHDEPHAKIPAASRKPAAIAGVTLVLAIGFAMVQGLGGILGQVSPNPLTIRFTEDGAVPDELTVRPGDTVTWVNEDSIPHVLSFATLNDSDGKPLESEALFPSSSTDTVIPATTAPGTYDYISKTAVHISGMIIVEAATAPVQTSTPPAAPVTTPTPVSTTPTPSVPVANDVAEPAVPSDLPPAYEASIPVNPHTVGSPEVPLPPRGANTTTSNVIRSHTPRTNTETGPALWIVVSASLAALLFVTRRSFRRL